MKSLNRIFILTVLIVNSFWFNVNAQTSITLGTDDWPPYEYEINGKITGYSTEIVNAVLGKMKISVSKNKIWPWARAEKMLSEGRIDALYSSSKSDKRAEWAYFPEEPLIASDWVMFIRKEDQNRLKFESLDDLKGKTIGIVRDYSYTPEFWEFIKKENNYQVVATDQLNFKMLKAGRFDFLISEYAVGLSIAKQLGLEGKIIALPDHPIKSTGLYIMFSKKTMSEEFTIRFSKKLKEFKTSSEFKEIEKRYF